MAQRTYAAGEGAIDAEPAGERTLKGYSRPLPTYRVPAPEREMAGDRHGGAGMTADNTLDPAGLERLLEITGGDLEFVDELVDTFLDDAEAQLAAMDAAVAAGDPEALVRPAHSLKSNSDNVGATALRDLARQLEADGKAGADVRPGDDRFPDPRRIRGRPRQRCWISASNR